MIMKTKENIKKEKSLLSQAIERKNNGEEFLSLTYENIIEGVHCKVDLRTISYNVVEEELSGAWYSVSFCYTLYNKNDSLKAEWKTHRFFQFASAEEKETKEEQKDRLDKEMYAFVLKNIEYRNFDFARIRAKESF